MPFVLDNSVVAGWLLENQATAYSDAVAQGLQRDQALVPSVWELEVTNVLRTACTRGRLQAERAQSMLAQLQNLPLVVDRTAVRPGEVLALALRHGLSTYDAAYLELALRHQCPLATVDAELSMAARASGVGVWAP